ncbi:hypothetical protein [Rhizobium sp.]|uniref:hypothetical protein n=1 Tax=Rhizobium sp. TaxID=391 RepID=UPI0039C9286C
MFLATGFASAGNRGQKGRKMTAILPIEMAVHDSDSLKELASIARLITYARQSAKSLEAEFPVWCLDLALGAVLQEMYANGLPIPLFEEGADKANMAFAH